MTGSTFLDPGQITAENIHWSTATTASRPFIDLSEDSWVVSERSTRAWQQPAPQRGNQALITRLPQDPTTPKFRAAAPCVSEGVARGPGHEVTLFRLRELLEEPETDEYGIARPSLYAYETAVKLLESAARLARVPVPRGSASTDFEGGVRLTWRFQNRELRLVLPASPQGKSYVYHESADNYGVDAVSSGEDLAKWLEWLAAEI